MKTLFQKELPKNYPLSEYLHVRDTFIRTFYKKTTGGIEKSDILSIGAAPAFKKQKSFEEESLDDLTAQFCDIVCPGRKSLISTYQLHYHLKRFPDAALAVQHAAVLVKDREDFEPHWPSAFNFACRVGCKETKWKLEDMKIKFQHELVDKEKNDLKKIFGKEHVPRVKCILKTEKNKIFRREFELITLADAQNLFRQYFPNHVALAYEFANRIVDPWGQGKVSVMQVKAYLKEKRDGVRTVLNDIEESVKEKREEVDGILNEIEELVQEKRESVHTVLNDIEELVNPIIKKVEVKPVPKEDPTDWMFKTLKKNGCEQFYGKFSKANIFEMNPRFPLTEDILETLGIDKFGDRWKLLDIFAKAEQSDEKIEKDEEIEAKDMRKKKKSKQRK